MEPTSAIPAGGDDKENLTHLNNVSKGGELPDSDNEEASNALDNLLKQATGEETPTPEEIAAKKKADEEAAQKADADAKKKADDEAAAKAAGTPPIADDEVKKKADADAKKKADDEAAAKAGTKKDAFDNVELPPYTKPKAAEAFATVKTLARQEIAAAQKEAEDAKAKLAEVQRKMTEAGKLPPEVEKELKELREFRQKLDVEADPAFKEWDSKVKANEEGIYKKLSEAGISEDAIKKIRDMGGPQEVDWEALNGKLPAQVRRYIEGKLFENESLAENKKTAVDKAKANAGEYLNSRAQALGTQGEEFVKATKAEYSTIAEKLPWMNPKTIDPKATAEEKAAAEAHNKFLADVQKDLDVALTDNTPQTKAILVAGYAQLIKVRADLAAQQAAHKAEVDKLTAELAEKSKLIEGIKKSSTSRLTSSAPSPGTAPVRPASALSEPTGDALDRHLAEALAKKAAAE